MKEKHTNSYFTKEYSDVVEAIDEEVQGGKHKDVFIPSFSHL